jgi:hypothetical protein
MAWSGVALDVEKGVAVDCPTTNYRHQIVSAKRDKSTGSTTVHYSVYYAPLGYKVKGRVPKDFQKEMCRSTPQTEREWLRMEAAYLDFSSQVYPQGKSTFRPHELAQALTYDLTFNENDELASFGLRATNALMTSYMTSEQAAAAAFAKKPAKRNQSLRLWHDVVTGNYSDNPDEASFCLATSLTTNLIQQKLYLLAMANGADLVYRADCGKHQNNTPVLYGHTRALVSGPPVNGMKPLIPATAVRQTVDCFNTTSLICMGNSEFSAPFPEGTAEAVAAHRSHMSTRRLEKRSQRLLGLEIAA